VSTQANAKGSLDAELRRACEAFIRDTSAPATRPILDLIAAAQDGRGADEKRGPAALSTAGAPTAAPSAAALDACLSQAEEAVEQHVATAYARTGAYLPQPSTQVSWLKG
jgi:predicted 2-oxoglutarate/Fe(II)-dependent dioxygenase YbiX